MKDKLAGGLVALVLGVAGLAAGWAAPWWVTGAALAGWIAANEYKIKKHSPPPPREADENTNVQFRYVEDWPGHWAVERVGED